MRTVPLALLLLGALALPAMAQDEPPTRSKRGARPVAKTEPAAVKGTRFKVELHSGRIFYGIRRGKEDLYWRWEIGRYVKCKPEDRGAGIRLWFPRDQNGSMMIPMELVAKVTEVGELLEKEGRSLSKGFEEAAERAVKERVELREEREAKLVEEEKAKLLEEVAAAKAAEDAAKSTEGSELARYTALLAQFPPGTWTLETPDQIAHRRAVLGLAATEEDMAFLVVFDEWKQAYAVWKKAQDKAAAEAKAAEEAAATSEGQPAEVKPGDKKK